MDEGAQARSHSEEAAALLLSSIFGSNSGGEENVLSCDLLQKPRGSHGLWLPVPNQANVRVTPTRGKKDLTGRWSEETPGKAFIITNASKVVDPSIYGVQDACEIDVKLFLIGCNLKFTVRVYLENVIHDLQTVEIYTHNSGRKETSPYSGVKPKKGNDAVLSLLALTGEDDSNDTSAGEGGEKRGGDQDADGDKDDSTSIEESHDTNVNSSQDEQTAKPSTTHVPNSTHYQPSQPSPTVGSTPKSHPTTDEKSFLLEIQQKPRGSGGAWVTITPNSNVRVTPERGKKIRIIATAINIPIEWSRLQVSLLERLGDQWVESSTPRAFLITGKRLSHESNENGRHTEIYQVDLKLFVLGRHIAFKLEVPSATGLETYSAVTVEMYTHNSGRREGISNTKRQKLVTESQESSTPPATTQQNVYGASRSHTSTQASLTQKPSTIDNGFIPTPEMLLQPNATAAAMPVAAFPLASTGLQMSLHPNFYPCTNFIMYPISSPYVAFVPQAATGMPMAADPRYLQYLQLQRQLMHTGVIPQSPVLTPYTKLRPVQTSAQSESSPMASSTPNNDEQARPREKRKREDATGEDDNSAAEDVPPPKRPNSSPSWSVSSPAESSESRSTNPSPVHTLSALLSTNTNEDVRTTLPSSATTIGTQATPIEDIRGAAPVVGIVPSHPVATSSSP